MNTERKPDISRYYIVYSVAILLCTGLYALCFGKGLYVIGSVLLTVASACLSVLLLSSQSVVPLLFLPVSAILSYLLSSRSVSVTVLSVAIVAVGACIALSIRKKATKISNILFCGIIFALFAALFAVFSYSAAGHALTLEAAKAYFDGVSSEIKAALAAGLDGIYEVYESHGISVEAQDRIDPESLFVTLKVMIPGFAVALIETVSYIAVSLSVLFLRASQLEILLPDPRYRMTPTSVSSIVFFASYAFIILFSRLSSLSVIYAASLNIAIIFTPLMFVCGVRGISDRVRNPITRRFSSILLVFAVIGVFLNVLIPVILLSFMGARDIIVYNRIISLSKKKPPEDED